MSHQKTITEIQAAIRAHSAWKVRLRDAIAKGVSEMTPEIVACDDKCEFGKWLHGPQVPPDLKSGTAYQNIKQMHADFHKCASSVLRMALSGQQDNAKQALSGDFTTRSSRLVMALSGWRDQLSA